MIKIISFLIISFSLTCCVPVESVQTSTNSTGAEVNNSRDLETAGDINSGGTGTYTLMIKRKDYGLSETKLIIDLGEDSEIKGKDFKEASFTVVDINKSGDGIQDIRGVSVTDRQGYALKSGRYVTIDLDFVMDPDLAIAGNYIVTLNNDLGKYKKGSKFIQKGRTIRR